MHVLERMQAFVDNSIVDLKKEKVKPLVINTNFPQDDSFHIITDEQQDVEAIF